MAALVLVAAVALPLVLGPGRGVSPAVAPPSCAGAGGLDAAPVTAAARAGADEGLRVAVAVLDTATGGCLVAGDLEGEFATASLVKLMIAARLLVDGQMTGRTAAIAKDMISRSDDAAANELWVQAGGRDLEPWIEGHYGVAGLGSPNDIPGRWGNTHVTVLGLVQLYARLRADPAVWPWLGPALHGMTPVAADGTDQVFGVPAVLPGSAAKQGWADGSADESSDAVVNSTGFAVEDRYVVVLLTQGHDNVSECDSRGFNREQADVVTAMAGTLAAALGGGSSSTGGTAGNVGPTRPSGAVPEGGGPAAVTAG